MCCCVAHVVDVSRSCSSCGREPAIWMGIGPCCGRTCRAGRVGLRRGGAGVRRGLGIAVNPEDFGALTTFASSAAARPVLQGSPSGLLRRVPQVVIRAAADGAGTGRGAAMVVGSGPSDSDGCTRQIRTRRSARWSAVFYVLRGVLNCPFRAQALDSRTDRSPGPVPTGSCRPRRRCPHRWDSQQR